MPATPQSHVETRLPLIYRLAYSYARKLAMLLDQCPADRERLLADFARRLTEQIRQAGLIYPARRQSRDAAPKTQIRCVPNPSPMWAIFHNRLEWERAVLADIPRGPQFAGFRRNTARWLRLDRERLRKEKQSPLALQPPKRADDPSRVRPPTARGKGHSSGSGVIEKKQRSAPRGKTGGAQ
jgi:hypothetical protein